MRYFFRPFPISASLLRKAGILSLLPFNQLIALKRVQMYETIFINQIFLILFCNIFFGVYVYICILAVYKNIDYIKSPLPAIIEISNK
jgi:hypothetical protein